jgi:EAL domain-containing protein (putative c-di-GMP-specific phosphodiesterase class I)
VADIITDGRYTVILSAIISIADQLSSNLVVEGVETIEQMTLLNKLGAKVYQGFYFSESLTATDLISFIVSHWDISI